MHSAHASAQLHSTVCQISGPRLAKSEVRLQHVIKYLEHPSQGQRAALPRQRYKFDGRNISELVICSLQQQGSSRLHGVRESTFTSNPLQQIASVSDKAGYFACSAAAGFGLGSGKEDPAAPLLGGDGGGNDGPTGGDGAGGNGFGKLVGEGDDEDAGDDSLLSLQQAEQLAGARGLELPADFVEAATSGGLRKSALDAYMTLQGGLIAGLLSRTVPAVRDRLINDPRYLYKVFIEVAIDACCATIAEVRKRGDDFWSEFEFYMSDLVVGCVLDVVLVSLMAPVAVIGRKPKSAKAVGLKKWLAGVPSAVLEASVPGAKVYSLPQRVACIFVKFGEYSLAGMFCGFFGQALANFGMMAKRKYVGASEHDVPPPPVVKTALTWGLFMGVSSNLRYQVVFGLERLVDVTAAKKFPAAAYVASFILRFANNVIGGEQFIDLARWTGVQ